MPKQIRVDVVSPFHIDRLHWSKSEAQSLMLECSLIWLNLTETFCLFVWSWQHSRGELWLGSSSTMINVKYVNRLYF